jgi:hypothetical protein
MWWEERKKYRWNLDTKMNVKMTIKIERREYVLLIVIFMFSLLVLFE